MTAPRIPCPTRAGTGNHTLGGGRDNAKDVCATCGGEGSVDPGTGASRAASANPVTGEAGTGEAGAPVFAPRNADELRQQLSAVLRRGADEIESLRAERQEVRGALPPELRDDELVHAIKALVMGEQSMREKWYGAAKRLEQATALADAMWQLLNDMGDHGLSVCLGAKAQARIAFEPFREEPEDTIGIMSLGAARSIADNVPEGYRKPALVLRELSPEEAHARAAALADARRREREAGR